jgi:hypothetical protein
MTDFYGNPEQANTPTTQLLAKHSTKQEPTGLFKLATRITAPMKAKLAADYLRCAARQIEESNAECVVFEFAAEEVKKE